jgi:hypothetical protein
MVSFVYLNVCLLAIALRTVRMTGYDRMGDDALETRAS